MTEPEIHVYEQQFPKHLGPPPVANGTGRRLHKATKPTYTVELDAGAFLAVWEHMESEARFRFPIRETMAYAGAYLRAIKSFRDAYWKENWPPPPPPETPRPRKRLVRSSKKA